MATLRQKLSTYAITLLTHQRRSHFQRTANAELFIDGGPDHGFPVHDGLIVMSGVGATATLNPCA